jgi:DNA-directed RNA polymerase subunit F
MSQSLDEYITNKVLTEGQDGRFELLAAWTAIVVNQIFNIPEDLEITKELVEPWGLTLIHALEISGFDPDEIQPISDEIMRLLTTDHDDITASKILDQLDDEDNNAA